MSNSNSIVRKNVIIMNDQAGVRDIRIEAFSNNYTPVIDSNYIEMYMIQGIYKSIGARPIIKNNIIKLKYGA